MFFISGKPYLHFQLNSVIQGVDTQNISQLKTKFQCPDPNKQAKPSNKNVQEHSKLTSAYLSVLTGDKHASWYERACQPHIPLH